MIERNNIQNELKELNSSLKDLHLINVYSVPGGYFENLSSLVLAKIRAINTDNVWEETEALSPLVNDISREMPYSIPDNYFDKAEHTRLLFQKQDVENVSVSEELEVLSPLLNRLKRQTTYQAPEGYFNKKIRVPFSRNKASVFKIHSPLYRIATAAIFIGLLVLTGLFIFKNGVDPVKNPQAWVEKNVKKVSTEKIDEIVSLASDDEILKTTEANDIQKTEEIKELMKDVSENEIQLFLNDVVVLDETDKTADLMN